MLCCDLIDLHYFEDLKNIGEFVVIVFLIEPNDDIILKLIFDI